MPQISPLIWPLIYLTLIHLLTMVILTLQEVSPRIVTINSSISVYQSNQWNW